jgi:hypothetical protein
MSTPEEIARQWKEEQERKLREAQNPNTKTLKVQIESDSKALKEVIAENVELQKELEDKEGEEAKKFFEDAKMVLEQKLSERGIEVKISSNEEFNNYRQVLQKMQELERDKSAPSGSAPMNEFQTGSNPINRGFASHEEMIQALRDQEHSSDPKIADNAKRILDTLFLKALKGVRENKSFMNEYDAPLPETKRVGDRVEPIEDDPFEINSRRRRRAKQKRDEQ